MTHPRVCLIRIHLNNVTECVVVGASRSFSLQRRCPGATDRLHLGMPFCGGLVSVVVKKRLNSFQRQAAVLKKQKVER